MSLTGSAAAPPPHAALEAARALLAAELEALGLPVPPFFVVEPGEAAGPGEEAAWSQPAATGQGEVPADHALRAEVHGTRRFDVVAPVSRGSLLPFEYRTRLPMAAPASALYTRAGWQPHPDQAEDPTALAFIDALRQGPGMGQDLQWSKKLAQGSMTLHWTIQLVADAADSCQVVVRTAPLGFLEDEAGVASFLAKVDALGALLAAWKGDLALPLGPAAPCLALGELPRGQEWDSAQPPPATPPSAAPAPPPSSPAAAPPAPEPDDAPPPDLPLTDTTPPPQPPADLITGPRLAPLAAALASFFIPGLGQVLCGQVMKGGVLMVATLFTCGLGGVLNLLAMADAWAVAAKLRRGGSVGPWSFFG